MSGKPVSPEVRLLSAQVRLGDPRAIKKIIAELKRARGDVAKTAEALGVSPRTLDLWRHASPDLAAPFEEHVRSVGRQPLPKPKLKPKKRVTGE